MARSAASPTFTSRMSCTLIPSSLSNPSAAVTSKGWSLSLRGLTEGQAGERARNEDVSCLKDHLETASTQRIDVLY
eukprot:3292310-Rhodomonas_salina.2